MEVVQSNSRVRFVCWQSKKWGVPRRNGESAGAGTTEDCTSRSCNGGGASYCCGRNRHVTNEKCGPQLWHFSARCSRQSGPVAALPCRRVQRFGRQDCWSEANNWLINVSGVAANWSDACPCQHVRCTKPVFLNVWERSFRRSCLLIFLPPPCPRSLT